MNCDIRNCTKAATVHVTVRGRPEVHYCEDHAVASGLFEKQVNDDEKRDAPRPFSANPPLLSGAEIRELSLLQGIRGREALRQFGAILLRLPSGEIGAVFPNEAYSVEIAERMGFVLNLDFLPFVASRSVIDSRAADASD